MFALIYNIFAHSICSDTVTFAVASRFC